MNKQRKPERESMRRFVGLVVLLALSSFYFSLPLEHTCWNQGGRVLFHPSPTVPVHLITAEFCSSTASLSRIELEQSHTDEGVCLACAWSQSLNNHESTAQLIQPDRLDSAPLALGELSPQLTDFIQIPLTRGPPAGSIL